MTQIAVPAQRPQPYVGRHRQPDPEMPDTRARDLAEFEGPTRPLGTPSSAAVSAVAVWRTGR